VKGVSDAILGEIIENVNFTSFSICNNGGYRPVTEDELIAQKKAYREAEKRQ
jgi:hypothetical protein